jgi:hypothetical protein
VCRGPPDLPVNQIDDELEVGEVTAHCLLNHESGESVCMLASFIGVDSVAQGSKECPLFNPLHDSPPVFS